MSRKSSACCLLLLAFVTASAVQADSLYRDPQRRFVLPVPTGWTQSAGEGFVKLSRGQSYATLLIVDSSGSAMELVSGIAQQIAKQWQDFRRIETQETTFGGRMGASTYGSGKNPAGVLALVFVSAAVSEGKGYAMIMSGSLEELTSLKADLDRIATGFLIGPGTGQPSAGGPGPGGVFDPGTSGPPAGAQPKDGPASRREPEDPGANFRAPDGSFSCRVPPGWRAQQAPAGGAALHALEPEDGGEERIIIHTAPATVNTLEELQQLAISTVMQLLPGIQPSGKPAITQMGSARVSEMRYEGTSAGRRVIWLHLVTLKEKQSVAVLAGARPERIQMVEQASRAVFRSIRPGGPEAGGASGASTGLARAIVGKWVSYKSGSVTGSSSSKEIVFYPNGRYEYNATFNARLGAGSSGDINLPTSVDPTTHVTGTYRIQGNTLYGQADNGQRATYTLELLPGPKLRIGGEEFVRE